MPRRGCPCFARMAALPAIIDMRRGGAASALAAMAGLETHRIVYVIKAGEADGDMVQAATRVGRDGHGMA